MSKATDEWQAPQQMGLRPHSPTLHAIVHWTHGRQPLPNVHSSSFIHDVRLHPGCPMCQDLATWFARREMPRRPQSFVVLSVESDALGPAGDVITSTRPNSLVGRAEMTGVRLIIRRSHGAVRCRRPQYLHTWQAMRTNEYHTHSSTCVSITARVRTHLTPTFLST